MSNISDPAGGEDRVELIANSISIASSAKGTLTVTPAGPVTREVVSEADLSFKVRIYEKDEETGHRLVTFSDDDDVLLTFDLFPSRIEIGMFVRRFLDDFDF